MTDDLACPFGWHTTKQEVVNKRAASNWRARRQERLTLRVEHETPLLDRLWGDEVGAYAGDPRTYIRRTHM